MTPVAVALIAGTILGWCACMAGAWRGFQWACRHADAMLAQAAEATAKADKAHQANVDHEADIASQIESLDQARIKFDVVRQHWIELLPTLAQIESLPTYTPATSPEREQT